MDSKFIVLVIIGVQCSLAAPMVDMGQESEDGALGIFDKGAFNMNDIKMLYDDFKLVGQLFRDFAEVSPFVRNLVTDAAEKNIKLKVIVQLLDGKYPDLGELGELATTKTGNMATDMDQTLQELSGYRKIENITHGTYWKRRHLRQLAGVFIGKNVVKSGHIKPLNDFGLIAHFIHDNRNAIEGIRHTILHPPINYRALLEEMKKLPLEQMFSQMSSEAKYTVSVPGEKKKTHDIAEDLVKQLKTVDNTPVTGANAEQMVNGVISLFGQLCQNILIELGADEANNLPM